MTNLDNSSAESASSAETTDSPAVARAYCASVPARPRWAKWGVRALTTLVILVVVTAFTDSLVAGRTEHLYSKTLYENSNLANPPSVFVAGSPYTASVFTHEVQAITVNVKDVDMPGWGLMSVHKSAQYVTLPWRAVLGQPFTNAPAKKVFTRLQLDGVTIGNKMQVDDLLIQNRDDISPRGGWETEAIFEGTPKGFKAPATVEMKLRIREGDVYLTPTAVLKGPSETAQEGLLGSAALVEGDQLSEGIRSRIERACTLKIPGERLPLKEKPKRVYVAGGSIFFESEQLYTTVSLQDLIPHGRRLAEEEKPGL